MSEFLCRHPYLLNKYEFVVADKPDVRFISVFDKHRKFIVPDNDCLNVFYTGENIEPDMSLCDYAISFSFTEDQNNYRLPCWVPRLYLNGKHPEDLLTKNRSEVSNEERDKYFCNFIFRNPVGFRELFFQRLNHLKYVDSPGKSCNNTPGIGATVIDKINYQRQYKFSIAIENECYPGYVTEKIIESFVAETVPIYMGDPTVTDDFNSDAFILIDSVETYDCAIERVVSVDNSWSSYLSIRNAPVYINDVLPEYAVEDNIMSFFEKIFDS